jgi:hypothetical protein
MKRLGLIFADVVMQKNHDRYVPSAEPIFGLHFGGPRLLYFGTPGLRYIGQTINFSRAAAGLTPAAFLMIWRSCALQPFQVRRKGANRSLPAFVR